MRYTITLLSLAFASAAVAQEMGGMPGMGMGGGMMMDSSEAGMCRTMRMERQLIALAANTTKLDQITKGNTTKSDAIKAKAATAQTNLSTMESNATLVADCQVIDAVAEEGNECNKIFLLGKFVDFAKNDTAIAILANNNQTRIDSLKAKATGAQEKLTTLQANATLTADCPAMLQKEECGLMMGLTMFVGFSSNATLVDMVTKGDTAKAAEIKADGELAQAQLDMMAMGAPTMADCASLKMMSGMPGMAPATAQASVATTEKADMAGMENMEGMNMETNNTIASEGKSAAGLEKVPSMGLAAGSTVFAVALIMSML